MQKAFAWVALFVVIAAGSGYFFGGVTPQAKQTAMNAHPECPHHWDSLFIVRDTAKGNGPAADQVGSGTVVPGNGANVQFGFALPNAITNIPEYHDCQRMREVKDGKATYGALIAVFANPQLGSIDSAAFTLPQAVAEVFVAELGSYPDLNITNTFSCLVLQQVPGDTPREVQWRGWMVPVERQKQCTQTFTPQQLQDLEPLPVIATKPPKGVDVPAVARWDWDPKASRQYIGVKCGSAWCEAGRKELTASPSYGVEMVKGHYDEQQLAEFPADAPMHPGENWGTVVPAGSLAKLTDATTAPVRRLAMMKGKWTHVADVYMRPEAGSYAESLNFVGDAGTPPSAKHARISLCRGGRKLCRPELPFLYFNKKCHVSPGDGEIWYGKIGQEGKRPKYFCVVYRAHPGAQIPAVTRWRWRVDDEGIWISCPEGCCETNADEFQASST